MEKRLQRSTEDGVRVLIVRAGDFFGPRAGNNWFSQALVKPGRPVTKIINPGTPGVGHQWSYLPDVARTIVELLDRRGNFDAFSRFHMSGHWDYDGKQFVEAIVRVVKRRTGRIPTVKRLPWWLFKLCAPFNRTFGEVSEMRYLWCRPVRMRNGRLVAALGHEPHTPLDDAIEATLAGLRCLPE
jgi:nucleoside-diphosphate-sugar epimerase